MNKQGWLFVFDSLLCSATPQCKSFIDLQQVSVMEGGSFDGGGEDIAIGKGRLQLASRARLCRTP